MKKYLIILICALLAFSLISCEKDKSEEMLDTFEAFNDTAKKASVMKEVFNSYINTDLPTTAADGKHEYSVALADDKGAKLNQKALEALIKWGLATEHDVKVTKWELTTGELKGKIEGDINTNGSLEVSVTNAKFTCTYDIVDGSEPEPIEKNKTYDFTINMKYKESKEGSKVSFYISFSINGKTNEVSYIIDTSTREMLSASINGKKVNLRIFQIIQNLVS